MSGLEQEFPERVRAHNVSVDEAGAQQAIEELGFESHGLVIRDAEGQVLWKQPDHEVQVEDARAKLRDIFKT